VSVLGLRPPCLGFKVEGSGWVMRECSEEVRLGIITLWSMLSRVGGRSSRVRGLRVKDGAIVALRYVGTESIAREVPQGPRLVVL
jgi:hypothetical protein